MKWNTLLELSSHRVNGCCVFAGLLYVSSDSTEQECFQAFEERDYVLILPDSGTASDKPFSWSSF